MRDDELLQSIVQAARKERDSRDSRLERLTRGEANDEELRVLEGEAAGDAEATQRLERHRPLSGDAQDRIASAILAQGGAAAKEARAREAEPPRGAPHRGGGVVRRLFWAVPPLAAAAAVVLFLSFRAPDTIPEYGMTVQAASDVRATPPTPVPSNVPVRLHPSSTLDIVLRPIAPLTGEVAMRAALVRGGKASPWAAPAEIAAGGAVRIRGRVDAIVPQATGTWEIVIAVARPNALPSDADLARRAVTGDKGGGDLRVRFARVTIEVVPEP